MLTEIPLLEELLKAHATQLGDDFTAYRNHTFRVANLCLAFTGDDQKQLEKIAIASAFHDLGIWTDGTFDYLRPSVQLACTHLSLVKREELTPEVSAMVLEHHKVSRYRGDDQTLVEPFRCADWVDVTRGLLTFGLPRRTINMINATWPSAGFHRRLIQFELKHLARHPLNPLPMVRL